MIFNFGTMFADWTANPDHLRRYKYEKTIDFGYERHDDDEHERAGSKSR